MRKGALILCGGKSSRMGRDKATLAFGPERAGMAMPLRILLMGQAFLFLAGHGNIVLLMAGRQRELMRSTLIVGALYALVLPAAIYGWGMAGAAIAKSLAAAERAVAAAVLTRRLLNVRTTAGLSPAMIKEALALFLKRGRRRGGDRPLANAEA